MPSQLQPAKMDQVRAGWDGRLHALEADVNGVAESLKRIDPGLRIWFGERSKPKCWIVGYFYCPDHSRIADGVTVGLYHEDCRACQEGRSCDLILTDTAYKNNLGVWEAPSPRIVARIEKIDGHGRGKYDFAAEVEKRGVEGEEAKRAKFREGVEEHGEELAHAIRKDMGWRYRGRAFVPEKPKGYK